MLTVSLETVSTLSGLCKSVRKSVSPSEIRKAVRKDDELLFVRRKSDNHAKLAVVVSSAPVCDRRFHLWPVESGDEVCEVAVVVFRLSS